MLSSLLAGQCALKASAKVLSFFGSAKLLQVFFQIISVFLILMQEKW